jgi:hypothetical protein
MSSLIPATSGSSPSSSSLSSERGRSLSDSAGMPSSLTVTTTKNDQEPLRNHNQQQQPSEEPPMSSSSSSSSDALGVVEAAIARGQAHAAAADSAPMAASTDPPNQSHTSVPGRRSRGSNNKTASSTTTMASTAPISSSSAMDPQQPQDQEPQPSAEESSSRPSKKRRTTTTPNTAALVRKDYGLLLPKDFLPIQYSTSPALATAAASSSSPATTATLRSTNGTTSHRRSSPAKRSAPTPPVSMIPHRWMGRQLLPLPALEHASRHHGAKEEDAAAAAAGSASPCWIESMLPEDVLGRCLYSGYLNSMETVRLGRVCKKWRSMARRSVSQLDLRRLSARDLLDQCQMKRLVSCFPHLTVRCSIHSNRRHWCTSGWFGFGSVPCWLFPRRASHRGFFFLCMSLVFYRPWMSVTVLNGVPIRNSRVWSP